MIAGKQPPKPRNDMASLAVLVKEPDKFAEVVNAVAHYEELLGASAHVDAAKREREEAAADRKEAADVVAAARAEAAAILQEAKGQAAAVENGANQMRADTERLARVTQEQAASWAKQKSEEEAALTSGKEALDNQYAALELSQTALSEEQRAWQSRLHNAKRMIDGEL